ncbi:hypothetical protein F511_25082 [Dorcoceras hygrometricum]|uniref:Uncharacterized protein n=1 Tax=Dorcoceras hygrometricum TaxID=472368 RepID=A0A2Z7AMV8_9LAMI|nr:hypothetical protein F511_25082 [Dorcoceras hygrometricum]
MERSVLRDRIGITREGCDVVSMGSDLLSERYGLQQTSSLCVVTTQIQLLVENCGSLRQSDPRPDPRLLRQTALEALTRSARTDSPRRTGQKQISGDDRRRRVGGGGGGVFERGRRRWCLGLGFAMGEL